MNIVEAWDVSDTDNLIRDLAQCVKRCMVLFEALTGSAICSRISDNLVEALQ